jgi:hypothetical protein
MRCSSDKISIKVINLHLHWIDKISCTVYILTFKFPSTLRIYQRRTIFIFSHLSYLCLCDHSLPWSPCLTLPFSLSHLTELPASDPKLQRFVALINCCGRPTGDYRDMDQNIISLFLTRHTKSSAKALRLGNGVR